MKRTLIHYLLLILLGIAVGYVMFGCRSTEIQVEIKDVKLVKIDTVNEERYRYHFYCESDKNDYVQYSTRPIEFLIVGRFYTGFFRR